MGTELTTDDVIGLVKKVTDWKPLNKDECWFRAVGLGYSGSVNGLRLEVHWYPRLFVKHNFQAAIYSNSGFELHHTPLLDSEKIKPLFDHARDSYSERLDILKNQEIERARQLANL